MAYKTPRPYICQDCGIVYLSRKTGVNKYCPLCRTKHRRDHKRDAAKAERRELSANRQATKKLAEDHPDSVLAYLFHRNDDDQYYQPPNEAEPVQYRPGSLAKIEAMAQRMLDGKPLQVKGDFVLSDA